jgi:hypothetical protein
MGLAELRPYGRPSATQGKIEWQVEGLQVPLIGLPSIWNGQTSAYCST